MAKGFGERESILQQAVEHDLPTLRLEGFWLILQIAIGSHGSRSWRRLLFLKALKCSGCLLICCSVSLRVCIIWVCIIWV